MLLFHFSSSEILPDEREFLVVTEEDEYREKEGDSLVFIGNGGNSNKIQELRNYVLILSKVCICLFSTINLSANELYIDIAFSETADLSVRKRKASGGDLAALENDAKRLKETTVTS